jgi:tetratricopeptide (TPR) repeat protein
VTADRTGGGNAFDGDAETVVQAGAVHGGIHVHGARRHFPPPRQLPLGVAGFVNRQDILHNLDTCLEDASRTGAVGSATVISAIGGAPGVGKTALALHWAHQVRSRFPDGDLYVDLCGYGPGPAATAEQALDGFLRALDVPPDGIPDDISERAALYRSMLDGRSVLVVIDNASATAQVRPLLPASRRCFVVITSRSTLAGLVSREGAARVTLDVLSPADSIDLLADVIGPGRVHGEPAAAHQVAELCGYLPLALRVVAERAASRPHLSLTDLVGELVGEQGRLDALTSSEDELSDVRAVFSWSYSALTSDLRMTFRLLGLHTGPDIGIGAAAALTGTDPATAGRRLRELAAVHLLQETETGRFRLHDLLRSYSGERAAAEDRLDERTLAVRRMLTWYLLTTDAGRRIILPHAHAVPLVPARAITPLGFSAVEEAMRWFDRERRNLLAALQAAIEYGQYDIGWKLPVVADGFFELRSHWADWEHIHRTGVQAALTLGDTLGEASNLLCLGDADWRSGRYDAATSNYHLTTDLSREIGDPWLQGFALRGLGLAQQEQQHLPEAGAYFEQALRVFQDGGIRRGEGMALLSLGECAKALGNPHDAVAYGERAVSIFDDIHDAWSKAWGTLSLAAVLADLGRSAEAADRLLQAAQTFRDFDDHRSEALALLPLGQLLLNSGDRAGAADCWVRAADIYETLGDPQAAEIRDRLATLDERSPE